MKTINVDSLAGRSAPSSVFVSNRWLAIQTVLRFWIARPEMETLAQPERYACEKAREGSQRELSVPDSCESLPVLCEVRGGY